MCMAACICLLLYAYVYSLSMMLYDFFIHYPTYSLRQTLKIKYRVC